MKRPSFAWMAPSITATGKRFGFDAHYFVKNGALVSAAHGLNVLKGLITGYLVTRMFPQTMYGEYKFILSIIGVIGFIGLPGLPTALATAIARSQKISIASIARWYGAISAVGSITLLCCIGLLPHWGRMDLWPMLLAGALIFSPSAVSTNIFGGIIRGTGEFSRSFFATLISNILVSVAVLAMLFIKPSPLLLLAFTSGIPAVVYLAMLIPYERRFRSTESQRPLIGRAFNLSIATIPVSLSWYIDGLLISALFGLNQLALFSVALLIPEQVKIWTKELTPILFSRQAGGKDDAARRKKMHEAVIIGTIIMGAGILLYVLATPYLIPVLFPQYDASQVIPLTNVAAITLLTAPASLYPQFLEARGLVKGVHWSNWSASIVFVIALFTLIPTFGPMGAVIARGMFRLTYAISSYLIIRRTPFQPDLA